uniref:RHS repeat domain-containing protein n=1 Tax=Bacteroides sp. UBA939 TaxID=1946092 RepID=UPI0025B88BA8
TYYIYDKADRLIFSQDGEQRKKSPKEWTFSIPDVFGRVCVTGICSNTYNALATTSPLVNVVIKADRNNTTSAYKGYTILGLNLTTPTVLTVNYYDNYIFLGQNNIPPNTDEKVKYTSEDGYGTWYGTDYTTANKVKNKGMLTGTLTAQLTGGTVSTTNYLYTVMYYDVKGRLVQSKSNNHLTGGSEKEYFAYNFTGQATKRKHVHVAAGTTQTEVYTYAYDDAGRLTSVKHKLNTGDEVILAANTYDELGRLKTSQRNGNASLKSTYTYNVRSWMKSISSTLFTQTLYYNDAYGSNTPRYNGNISAMSWKLSNESKTRGYRFTYDNLSRLTAAGYLENGSVNSNFNTTYTYDKHGNMTGLTRRGNTGTSTYGIIDNLTMTYAGNQLIKAEDSGASVSLSASMDFKNGSNTAREYYYNRNGNLIKDLNKGISNISYNLLNLPCSLAISNSSGSATNTYVYAVDGRKLTATISGKKTDYAGNMIYENSTLKRILIEGGYIEIGSGSTTNDTYHFYLTDHLGNNRVVAKGSGTIVQSNHYYPYGMLFTEGTQTSSQPYKFGGKELDTQKGLNWYDFEARWKDDWSFPTPDPLAEKYYSISPYVYCMNNPMRYIDPNGEEVVALGEVSRRNISNTLTKKEAKFVKFEKDGTLNVSRLNKSKSESENMLALKTLANSETTYNFSVTDKDVEGEAFSLTYKGLTAIPGEENKSSPDGNVWIQTSSFLDEKGQAQNVAHEAYGHAYFYELKKTDKSYDYNHRYVNVAGEPEWDAEFNMYVVPNIRTETNLRLKKQIEIVTKQAGKNYDDKKK